MKYLLVMLGMIMVLEMVKASGFDFDFSSLFKPGQCPVKETLPECPDKEEFECIADLDCPGTQKCCGVGCDVICVNTDGTIPSELKERPECPGAKEDTVCSAKSHDQCRWDKQCFDGQKCCFDGCKFTCTGESIPANPICDEAIDIGFLVDTSGSLSQHDFNLGKEIIKNMISLFDVSDTAAHVSISTIGDEPEIILSFKQGSSRDNVLSAIEYIPYEKGSSRLDLAVLEATKGMFKTVGGMRKNVRKALIVITDGKSSGESSDTSANIRRLKAKGVEVYSLGLTRDVEVLTLLQLATSETNVFPAVYYEQMLSTVKTVASQMCK